MFQNPQHQGQTPLYRPAFPEALSPRSMWKEEKKPTETIEIPEPAYESDEKETYKHLIDDEKNLLCAGIITSNAYRKFLKPYLEGFANPPRRSVRSDADYYRLMEENAIAEFVTSLISTLEGRARRSPAYSHSSEIEEEA